MSMHGRTVLLSTEITGWASWASHLGRCRWSSLGSCFLFTQHLLARALALALLANPGARRSCSHACLKQLHTNGDLKPHLAQVPLLRIDSWASWDAQLGRLSPHLRKLANHLGVGEDYIMHCRTGRREVRIWSHYKIFGSSTAYLV